MKFGFLFSFIIHTIIIIVLVTNIISDLFPEPDVQIMKVKLITAKEIKKTVEKPKEKIRTQQSAAPKAPPKKEQPKQKKQDEKKKPTVISKNSIKQEELKEKKQEEQKEVKKEQKSEIRPDKLDKSEDKKNIIQSKDAKLKETPEEDFMAVLDFAKELEKDKKVAQIQSEEETEPTATFEDQADIAIVKKHIEKNWYKTPGIKNLKNLVVLIELRMNRDGTLVNAKVVKSSGEMFFDNSILRAVRRSAPLPFPPEKYDLFRITEIYFNGKEL